ncbi:hypothetical protein CP01DC11_1376B, partial [Chlamydia psittaci 01DC11]
DKPWRF